MSLLVAFIVGLGESADGDLLGARAALEDEEIAGRFVFLSAEHDNDDRLMVIRHAIYQHHRKILIGHSLGGEAAYQLAAEAAPEAIDVLVLEDAVRGESHGFDSPQDRPADLFKTPTNVIEGVAFFGTKDIWPRGNCFESPPWEDGFYNVPIPDGHSRIPSHPVVTTYIISKIKELIA